MQITALIKPKMSGRAELLPFAQISIKLSIQGQVVPLAKKRKVDSARAAKDPKEFNPIR